MKSKFSKQLVIGTGVEMEHKGTIRRFAEKGISIRKVASNIAKDHLRENPQYYVKLRKAKL